MNTDSDPGALEPRQGRVLAGLCHRGRRGRELCLVLLEMCSVGRAGAGQAEPGCCLNRDKLLHHSGSATAEPMRVRLAASSLLIRLLLLSLL